MKPLICSRDVLLQSDTTLDALLSNNVPRKFKYGKTIFDSSQKAMLQSTDGFDAIVLPGGMGGAKAFESVRN